MRSMTPAHTQSRTPWATWVVAFGSWVVLFVVGEAVFPSGSFRDWVWPVLAGVLVAASAVVLRRIRRV